MQHLACIMDGNRRFAKKHGWMPWIGHKKGVDAVRIALEYCLKNKIRYLSLYTFSLENFKRSEDEKNYLFDLICAMSKQHIHEFLEQNVKVRFLGERTLFPEHVKVICDEFEEKTKHCNALQVNFLFCYGSQQEIIAAAKQIALKFKQGLISLDDLDEQQFAQHLWTSDTPAPDLIIRTGGQQRISNFLLFQSAYSEFYFTDLMWPELTMRDFEAAGSIFNERKRNFGS